MKFKTQSFFPLQVNYSLCVLCFEWTNHISIYILQAQSSIYRCPHLADPTVHRPCLPLLTLEVTKLIESVGNRKVLPRSCPRRVVSLGCIILVPQPSLAQVVRVAVVCRGLTWVRDVTLVSRPVSREVWETCVCCNLRTRRELMRKMNLLTISKLPCLSTPRGESSS